MNIAIDHRDVVVETDEGTATVSFVAHTIDHKGPHTIYRFTVTLSPRRVGEQPATGILSAPLNHSFDAHRAARMVVDALGEAGMPKRLPMPRSA
jgi:hypothetical protein